MLLVSFRECTLTGIYMGVEPKIRGTPKSRILIGFSIIFTIHFGGKIPLLLETPICHSKSFIHSLFVRSFVCSFNSLKSFTHEKFISWEPKGIYPPYATFTPQEIAGPKNAGLIKGNQWVFIVPKNKGPRLFPGGPTWHRGGYIPLGSHDFI